MVTTTNTIIYLAIDIYSAIKIHVCMHIQHHMPLQGSYSECSLCNKIYIYIFSFPVGDCGPPPSLSNGRFRLSPRGSTVFKASAVYSCDSGFTLQGGKSRRECQSNQSWSGRELSCARKLLIYKILCFHFLE